MREGCEYSDTAFSGNCKGSVPASNCQIDSFPFIKILKCDSYTLSYKCKPQYLIIMVVFGCDIGNMVGMWLLHAASEGDVDEREEQRQKQREHLLL